MSVANTLWACRGNAEPERTTIASNTIGVTVTLIDLRCANTLSTAEQRNANLSALAVIGARNRFDTPSTDAKGVVRAIIYVGTRTIGADAGLLLADLGLVRTIAVSGAKIGPLFATTVQAALIIGALGVADAFRLDAEAVFADGHAVAIIILFTFGSERGHLNFDIKTSAFREGVGKYVVNARFSSLDFDKRK
tara:strand:- start:315 stop:893 length:579 start_codon:yes stop_codon:yes gene_type:complete